MTKKQIVFLLIPNATFVFVAIAALWMDRIIRDHTRDNGQPQKFERFVENVRSGKWPLTTDLALEGMRRSLNEADAFRLASLSDANVMRDFAWSLSSGVGMQILAVIYVARKLRKAVPDKPPHAAQPTPAA